MEHVTRHGCGRRASLKCVDDYIHRSHQLALVCID